MKNHVYGIKKNGKFVKDFSEGKEFTTLRNFNQVEKYLTKKGAVIAAQGYGNKNGAGYTVVEIY
ncbi:MAG: hypothetical protein LIP12_09130 [Clostridiales bacterium]|nr:hypothetical protein [Clostridiales bacterium]